MGSGWDKIIGHQRVVRYLRRSLELGRTAHAYLLVGPPRVGKGTLALAIAQAFNCVASDPPCGQCPQCLRIQAGKHPDVQVISVSSSSENRGSPKEIALGQVKEMEHSVSLKPFEGRTRVFILDGAERLSAEAANALLKTLEEPPPQTLLILLSAEADALLPTIRSRCQNFTLIPVAENEIKEELITRFTLTEERASLLAHLAQGRVGWALEAASQEGLLTQHQQALDELVAIPGVSLVQRLAFAQRLVGMYYRDKVAFKELLDTWQTWWRDALLMKIGLGELLCNQDRQELLLKESDRLTYEEALGFIRKLQGAWENLEWNANPRMVLDLLLLGVPKSYERLRS